MAGLTLLTGADGFIGRHLAAALVARGERVRGLVQKATNASYLEGCHVEIIRGDLLDPSSLEPCVEGVDQVLHLAARVRPLRIFERQRDAANAYHRANSLGTENLARLCARRGISKFVHFSSIAAGGHFPDMDETFCDAPATCYGKSKLEAERLLMRLHLETGFPAVILRPSYVYGPGGIFVLTLARQIRRGLVPVIGEGSNRVSLCYVDDIVRAALLALDRAAVGKLYYIAESAHPLNFILRTIARGLGAPLRVINLPTPVCSAVASLKEWIERPLPWKISPLRLDVSKEAVLSAARDCSCSSLKARRELGFIPKIALPEGIERTLRWHRANGDI
jgi:UDP-glucose 4-epimerase